MIEPREDAEDAKGNSERFPSRLCVFRGQFPSVLLRLLRFFAATLRPSPTMDCGLWTVDFPRRSCGVAFRWGVVLGEGA